MIKNIIFDIGNVLMTYQPKKYLDEKYQDEKITQKVLADLFLSDDWLKLDQGLISEREVVERLSEKEPAYRKYYEAVFHDWAKLLPKKEESFAFVKTLKEKGYHLYLLSNLQETTWHFICQNYPEFSFYFDGYVLSYQEHLLKPDAAIYQTLLERYHLQADESLFIDDVQSNVEGAKQCGVEAILFTSLDDVMKTCQRLGVS